MFPATSAAFLEVVEDFGIHCNAGFLQVLVCTHIYGGYDNHLCILLYCDSLDPTEMAENRVSMEVNSLARNLEETAGVYQYCFNSDNVT